MDEPLKLVHEHIFIEDATEKGIINIKLPDWPMIYYSQVAWLTNDLLQQGSKLKYKYAT